MKKLPQKLRGSTATVPLLIIMMAYLLSGCASSKNTRQNGELSKSEMESLMNRRQTDSEYIIQRGDEIEVSVWGYEEFNSTKTVNAQGIITIPLVGEMEADGLSKEEFKANLKNKLKKFIEDEINFTVSITSVNKSIVSVLGSVNEPDNYELIGSVTLFEILSKAGGTTEQADLRNIRIYRRGEEKEPIEVNVANYLKEKEAGPVAVVQPGNVVYVPRQENAMREMSSFLRDVVLLFGMFRVFN